MAKTREIVCVNYVCEGTCSIGRDGTFYHQCQTCREYKPKSGAEPARKDLRAKKQADADRKINKMD